MTEAHLFTDHPEASEPTDGFALWFRSSTRAKWKRVATAQTTQELLTHMDQIGSGGFTLQPIGKDPNDDKAA
jgi:hypothetical protein